MSREGCSRTESRLPIPREAQLDSGRNHPLRDMNSSENGHRNNEIDKSHTIRVRGCARCTRDMLVVSRALGSLEPCVLAGGGRGQLSPNQMVPLIAPLHGERWCFQAYLIRISAFLSILIQKIISVEFFSELPIVFFPVISVFSLTNHNLKVPQPNCFVTTTTNGLLHQGDPPAAGAKAQTQSTDVLQNSYSIGWSSPTVSLAVD
eukprot:gene24062-biopygen9805